jgi:glycosyltransferase involved in cell wall biosynthesis
MYSFIVPAHNEEDFILNILTDINNQDFAKEFYEVVIVDNASIDNTVTRVWDFAISHPDLNLKLVHENRLGVSRARNLGALNSNFEKLIFLDADNNIDFNFLRRVDLYTNKRKVSVATFKTLPNKFSLIESIFFACLELIKLMHLKPFGKIFVEKNIFKRVGGFNFEIYLGENVDFLNKAKKYAIKNNLVFSHISVTTIKCSLRRFEKKGFLPVIVPWFIAYLGFYKLKYPVMSDQ